MCARVYISPQFVKLRLGNSASALLQTKKPDEVNSLVVAYSEAVAVILSRFRPYLLNYEPIWDPRK